MSIRTTYTRCLYAIIPCPSLNRNKHHLTACHNQVDGNSYYSTNWSVIFECNSTPSTCKCVSSCCIGILAPAERPRRRNMKAQKAVLNDIHNNMHIRCRRPPQNAIRRLNYAVVFAPPHTPRWACKLFNASNFPSLLLRQVPKIANQEGPGGPF